MKPARLIALVVALGAAAAAAFLVAGRSPPKPEVKIETALPVTNSILVAANDVAMGSGIRATDLRWQVWPHDTIPMGATKLSEFPNAHIEFVGMTTRTALMAGQPVSQNLLAKAAGFLSAILPAGKRALAVNVDNRGSSSAGNFIFPNDRVDIIQVSNFGADQRSNGGETSIAETILRNIRVLAIGANVDRKDGAQTSVGSTATLEVSPAQAELLANAQKDGPLILSLRSFADADANPPERRNVMTIVRFGQSQTSSKQ